MGDVAKPSMIISHVGKLDSLAAAVATPLGGFMVTVAKLDYFFIADESKTLFPNWTPIRD